MAVNFAKPVTSDLRADVLAFIRDNLVGQAKMYAGETLANTPTDAIRYNPTLSTFEKWNGGAWATLSMSADNILTGAFRVKQQIERAVMAAGASDYHLELFSPDPGSTAGQIGLRFHLGNRWWRQVRAEASGFRFTEGSSDTLVQITAGRGYFDVGATSDEVMTVAAAASPFIAWRRGSTRKAYIQHSSGDLLYIVNEANGGVYFYANNALSAAVGLSGSFVQYGASGNAVRAFDGSGFYEEVTGGLPWRVYTGGVESLKLDASATLTTYRPMRIRSAGSSALSRTTILHTEGVAPIGLGAYAGAWRSALEIDGPGAELLFLAPPDTANSTNAIIRSVGTHGGIDLRVGGTSSDQGISGLLLGADAYAYFANWIRLPNSTGFYTNQSNYLYPRDAGSGGDGWRMRGGQNATSNYLAFERGDGSQMGYLQWTHTSHMKFVSNAGFSLHSNDSFSYGSFYASGTVGGYAGLALNVTGVPTFMASAGGANGIYLQGGGYGRWAFYDDGGTSPTYFRVGGKIINEANANIPYVRIESGGEAAGGRITISTSAASGTPEDGDIWIQRAA